MTIVGHHSLFLSRSFDYLFIIVMGRQHQLIVPRELGLPQT